MASSKWKNYEEINEKIKGKKVVFWGIADWIGRTLSKSDIRVDYLVDNSKLNQGIIYSDLNVFSPQELKKEKKDKVYIVITTASYLSVIDELHEMGFVMGENFCCSPELEKRKDKDDFLSHKATVLISSPNHNFDEKSGGGLYKYTINPKKEKKVYSGKCRTVIKGGNKYYILDMLKGVVILDLKFNVLDVIELQKNTEPHGLTIDEENNHLYVGQPGRDSIGIYSLDTKKLVNEIFLSDKWKRNKKDNHHLNDLCIHENSLFVSLFSFSGNWENEIYDGGILEFNKESGEKIGPVVTGLWMPHSVMRINGKLSYLNSMKSELYNGSRNKLATFRGFTRGLDYDGKYYFIATTGHRYPEKLMNTLDNISLDCGFYVFDEKTKLSKFFNIDSCESVHSLIVI